ncbi:Conserved_hypothetical protein [Hexamita inflata]|uniref:Uncharacterized protein n=1 Tax=Hexamita inflata TaxID=28002 RepID=A0AA86S3D0_9EUKA|nr:Conserved hypothetical protein [Hexamita inflata]
MELLEYLRAFPEQSPDPGVFITQREHEELCGAAQELLDSQGATAALPQVFRELFYGMKLPTTLQKQVNYYSFRRSQCRLRYAITYFMFFCLRQHTQYFHPFDQSNYVQNRFVQQNPKKNQLTEFQSSAGHVLLFDITNLLINNLKFLLNTAEAENCVSKVKVFGPDYNSEIKFEQSEMREKRPTVDFFNIYENFSEMDRQVLKVTLDTLACIRSKPHLEIIMQFVYKEFSTINNNINRQFQVIDQENLIKCNYRQQIIYQTTIVGAVLGSIGSMFGSCLALLQYCIGEGKKVGDKQDQIFAEVLEELAHVIMKVVLVFVENQEGQDQLIMETINQLLQQQNLNKSQADPVNLTDDFDQFRMQLYQFFMCSLLIPIQQTCTQFSTLYDNVDFQKYMQYQQFVTLCPNLQKALNYAGARGNTRNFIYVFAEIFQSLTLINKEFIVTEHCQIHDITILGAELFKFQLQPVQILQVLNDDSGVFQIADYLMSQKKFISVEFLKRMIMQAAKTKIDSRTNAEALTMISIFRALIQSQQTIRGDRNSVHFMIHYYYRFTDLQFYNNEEFNQFFPSQISCKLPQCVLEQPQLCQISNDTEELPNLQLNMLKEVRSECCKTVNDLLDETSDIRVTTLQRICGLAHFGKITGQILMEGLLTVLQLSDYYLSRDVNYEYTCNIYNTILVISDSLLDTQNLFEQFISLDPMCKFCVMDCLCSFSLNRQIAGSVVMRDILQLKEAPKPEKKPVKNWGSDGMSKIFNQYLSEDFLGADQVPDLDEFLALQNEDDSENITSLSQEQPFSFQTDCVNSSDKFLMDNIRLSCQLMTRSVHDIHTSQIYQRLRKQITTNLTESDPNHPINLIKAIVSTAWLLSFVLDECTQFRPETQLLKQLNFILQPRTELQMMGEFKITDQFNQIRRAIFKLLDQFSNADLIQEVSALVYLGTTGQSISVAINKATQFDQFVFPTQIMGANQQLLAQNMFASITNEILSKKYKFWQSVVQFGSVEVENKEEPPKQPENKKKDKKKKDKSEKDKTEKPADQTEETKEVEKVQNTQINLEPFFKPLKSFISLSSATTPNLITSTALVSSLYFDDLKPLDANAIQNIKIYTQTDNSQLKSPSANENEILCQSVAFYCQADLEEFKNYTGDYTHRTLVCQRVIQLFMRLLSDACALNISNQQKMSTIYQLILLGFAKFLSSQQLQVQSTQIWHVKLSQCEIIDLYEQIINSVSQVYSKVADSDVKNACIQLLKQMLILLNSRSNKQQNLPFKLDFILKIHQLCPFSETELFSVLKFPYIQRSSVQDTVHVFFQNNKSQLFVKTVLSALRYNSKNYKSNEGYLPDSILYLFSFVPQFCQDVPNTFSSSLITQKHLDLFTDLLFVFEYLQAGRDQYGFSPDQQFQQDVFVGCLKALEHFFKRLELVQPVLSVKFLQMILENTQVSDMVHVVLNTQLREQKLTLEQQLQSKSYLLDISKLIAKLLPKLFINRKNYAFALKYALENTKFVLLQALFMINPAQYIKTYNQTTMANSLHALTLLLAISCKTPQDCPVFFQYYFRNQLSFSIVFEQYLYEKVKQKTDDFDLISDNGNVLDLQRAQFVEQFIKEEQRSPKSQQLVELVLEYKENMSQLCIFAIQTLVLNAIVDKSQLNYLTSMFQSQLIDKTEPEAGQQQSFVHQFIQNLPAQPQTAFPQHYQNAISTAVRAVADYCGIYFSGQQLSILNGISDESNSQLLKFLTARFIFCTNSFQYFDNDFFQVIEYRQNEFQQVSSNIKVQNSQKESFNSNFGLILKKIFQKFYPECVIQFVDQFSLFTKDFILGIGADWSGEYLSIEKYLQEPHQKQFQLATSGQFGTVNQFSKKYLSLVQPLFDERFLNQIQNQETFQNVKFISEQFTNLSSVWNRENGVLLDLLDCFLNQLIYPEELKTREMKQLDIIIKQSYMPAPSTIQNICLINQYTVTNFNQLEQSQMFIIKKSLGLIKTLMTAQVTKQTIYQAFVQTATQTALKININSVVMMCADILHSLLMAGIAIPAQSMLLVVGKLIATGKIKQGFELLLMKQPAYFFTIDQQQMDIVKKKLNIVGDDLTEEQLKLVQLEMFMEMCRGYGVDGAVAALLIK